MPACTFFGDSHCGDSVYSCLLAVIEKLIATEKVSTFYVGNNGNFDKLVQKALHQIKQEHTGVNCYTVLAYLPGEKKEFDLPSPLETIYPEGIENTPLRYAINSRNLWMINNSAFVVTYPSPFGNSAKLSDIAFFKKKYVINLKEEMQELFPFRK
ncbi:MAG: hypothetical protein IJ306_09960 [Oscillospiraceae bacterium]|nr:hypothetical protein [Oscillospiraceae bacterium]